MWPLLKNCWCRAPPILGFYKNVTVSISTINENGQKLYSCIQIHFFRKLKMNIEEKYKVKPIF